MNKKTFKAIKNFSNQHDISVLINDDKLFFKMYSLDGDAIVWSMHTDKINNFSDFAFQLKDVLPTIDPYEHVLFLMGGECDGFTLALVHDRATEISEGLDGLYDDSFKEDIVCMDDVRKIVAQNGLICDIRDGQFMLSSVDGDFLHSFYLEYNEDSVINITKVLGELYLAWLNFDVTDYCYEQMGLDQGSAVGGEFSIDDLLNDTDNINEMLQNFRRKAEKKAQSMNRRKNKEQ